MSSSTFVPPPPAPTFSPNPPNSNSNPETGPSIASSASLYLYTFLATLVLLLGVSSAIVARSFVLRRRHRRMVEEAIRNGTWIPPPTRDGANPGAKPDMFEAYLASEMGSLDNQIDAGGYGKKEDVDWDAIMPFSAAYLQHHLTDPNTPQTPHPTSPSAPLSARLRSLFPTHRHAADASLPLPVISPLTTSPAPSGPNLQPETMPPPPSTLRVAVLIAMPFPRNGKNESEGGGVEEESIPHVEFGVVDVCVGEETGESDGERRKRLSEESGVSLGV